MKFLAILRDSVREARDTKVFYFTLGFSAFVILVTASLSFQPVSVEDSVTRFAGRLTWIFGFATQGGAPPRWSVTNFEQSNAGTVNIQTEPWLGDYRFEIRVDLDEAKRMEDFKKSGLGTPTDIKKVLQDEFAYLKNIEVTECTPATPTELCFAVTTAGSKVTTMKGWPHEPALAFGAIPLRWLRGPLALQVYFIEDILVNSWGAAIALLLSSIITAFFIPNMLRKGAVDLLLSKPIHRTSLLLYKYVGGLTFMFLNTAFLVVGLWLVLGWRSGLWGPGFLWSIPILTFQFAIYYAVSTLFAVLTRSPIVAILMSCLAWLVFTGVGWGYRYIDSTKDIPGPERFFPEWVYDGGRVVHYILPRIKDIDKLTTKLVAGDLLSADSEVLKNADVAFASFSWGESISVSAIYIAVLLGLASWRFATRDY
jgi:hypothetical protein